MRTSNPVLNEKAFSNLVGTANPMTIQGTVNKTGVLLLLVVLASAISWGSRFASIFMWVGIFGGLGMSILTVVKKEWAGVTAPMYALLEGLFLGAISSVFEARYPGIVFQAVGLTFGTTACLLGAYTSGAIKASENFKLGIVAATGGIAVFYLITLVMSFFGFGMPIVFGNGLIGIAFSLFVVTIAALNLVLDFDFIESASQAGAPQYMEWYGAFGLMVTLIWLYIEILRLLSKLKSRK